VIKDRDGFIFGACVKKSSKLVFVRKLGFERGLAVAGEPAEDLIDLGPGATPLLCLGNIGRIDSRDGHGIEAAPVSGGFGSFLVHGD
jgi:hypothetical protein